MYRKLNTKLLVSASCIAAMMGGASSVYAQEEKTDLVTQMFLEEIVVTARKREESLQDIPISVTAFNGSQLQALGANESGDVAKFTPNFTWNTEFGRASPQPFIRGVGSNGFMPNNQNPVAVYSDNVVIGPNIAQGFAAFDIDRVEVLKGPQGTLYGRNATAGLINFISVKPEIGDGFSGFAQIEAGSFSTVNTEAAIEADLSETSAFRLSVATNKNNGLYDNLNLGGRSGTTDDVAARLQLRLQPNENLDILFNIHAGDSDPDVSPFKAVGTICPPGVNVPTLGVCRAGAGSDTTDLFEGFSGPTQETVETSGGFLNVDYSFGDLTLTSITAFENSELGRLDDVDDLAAFQENDHFADEFDSFSQELRLSGGNDTMNWHIGGFYYKEEYAGEFLADFVVGSVGNIKDIDTESYALFGQLNYQISDRVSATAGLRYTNEDKELSYLAFFGTGNLGPNFFNSVEASGISILSQATATNADSFTDLSGRFSLDYAVSDDLLVYGSYARGFKAGDVNGLAFATTGPELALQSRIVDPETLDAFELGFKGTFADGALRVNGALFYYIYKDQQQSILLPVPGAALPLPVTTFANAAESSIPGAELDIVWSPADSWLVIANFGYVDATYDEFIANPAETNPALINDFSGNRVPLTSEFEATLLISKDFVMGNGGVLTMQGNGRYQSDVFFQPTNEPGLSEDSQFVLGARIAYTPPTEKWELSLAAENLTDEQYFVSGFNFDVPGVNSLHVKTNTPRLITAKLRVNF